MKYYYKPQLLVLSNSILSPSGNIIKLLPVAKYNFIHLVIRT